MTKIEVKKIVKALNASDGAGVKLKRSIGTPEADYIDPFLMLDEFGSENKDDYIAGFPPHPHRGIETVTYMLNGDEPKQQNLLRQLQPLHKPYLNNQIQVFSKRLKRYG